MRSAERKEDMSEFGRLRVMQDNEGDMQVSIIPCMKKDYDAPMLTVEFCVSGGKSPRTRAALYELMMAMQADSEKTA